MWACQRVNPEKMKEHQSIYFKNWAGIVKIYVCSIRILSTKRVDVQRVPLSTRPYAMLEKKVKANLMSDAP